MTGARDEKDVDAPLYRNFSPGAAARTPAGRRRLDFLLCLVPIISLLMILAFDEPLALFFASAKPEPAPMEELRDAPAGIAAVRSPVSSFPRIQSGARLVRPFVPAEWLESRDVVPHQHHIAIMGAAAGGLVGIRGGLAGFVAGAAAGSLAGAWHDLEAKRRREESRLADAPSPAARKRS